MLATELILKKKNGEALSTEELHQWMTGYLSGAVTDYQMSAWLMAVCFQGMNTQEMRDWTELTWKSGVSFPRENRHDYWIDKHSTGGVGDKTSLILVPLVKVVSEKLLGAGKVRIPMVSGRGLGHTGGTLDKLESVPGFKTGIALSEGAQLLSKNGYVMMGQTDEIAPADRRLYALRDVTGTVASRPLIVASILGKKLSESLDGIVLDVKFGDGAFMRTSSDARELAKSLVETAKACGVEAVAILTSMEEPLGKTVGNRLEVEECAEFLKGKERDRDLEEVVLALASSMITLASRHTITEVQAADACRRVLDSGEAFDEFVKMFRAQGGNWEAFSTADVGHLKVFEAKAMESGWLEKLSALELGKLLVRMGGGRKIASDKVDSDVGIRVFAKIGDRVEKGQTLLKVFYRTESSRAEIEMSVATAVRITNKSVAKSKWIEGRI